MKKRVFDSAILALFLVYMTMLAPVAYAANESVLDNQTFVPFDFNTSDSGSFVDPVENLTADTPNNDTPEDTLNESNLVNTLTDEPEPETPEFIEEPSRDLQNKVSQKISRRLAMPDKLPNSGLDIPSKSMMSRSRSFIVQSASVRSNIDEGIYAALDSVGKVKVIVMMKAPADVWSSMSSKSASQKAEVGKEMRDITISNNVGRSMVRYEYSSFNGFAATVSWEELALLNDNPMVDHIYLDQPTEAFLDESISIIGADDVWNTQEDGVNLTGLGQTICVLDTGVDYTHTALGACNISCQGYIEENYTMPAGAYPGFPDNYTDNNTLHPFHSINRSGWDNIAVYFESVDIESGDYLDIFNNYHGGDNDWLQSLQGQDSGFWSVRVGGDTARLRIWTFDYGGEDTLSAAGYNITKIRTMPACEWSNCSKIVGGRDFWNDDNDPVDDHGHGTHVAGIIGAEGGSYLGVAPDAKQVSVKVLNSSGLGYSSDISYGIEWCNHHADEFNISVISMSLGFGQYSGYCDSQQAYISAAINESVDNNISVIVATGNNGWTSDISAPACIQNAIPVVNFDKSDVMAGNSNRNALALLGAPGVSITSTSISGGYVGMSGTSMSTPHVAGSIALINQYLELTAQTMTPLEIEDLLNDTGKSIYDSGSGINYSRINVYDALTSIGAGDGILSVEVDKYSISPDYIHDLMFEFVINITNDGDVNLTDVMAYDDFNDSVMAFNASSCPLGDSGQGYFDINVTECKESLLEVGESYAVYVNFSDGSADLPAITANFVEVNVSDSLGRYTDDSDSADVTLRRPNITVTKTLLNGGNISVEDMVMFMINVTNFDLGDVNFTNLSLFDYFNNSYLEMNTASVPPTGVDNESGEVEWVFNLTDYFIVYANFTALQAGNTTNEVLIEEFEPEGNTTHDSDNVSFMILGDESLNVTLIYPANATTIDSGNFTFNFTVDVSSNCAHYWNSSGAWAQNVNLSGNGHTSFSVNNMDDGSYIWNVYCVDSDDSSNNAWSYENWSFTVAAASEDEVVNVTLVKSLLTENVSVEDNIQFMINLTNIGVSSLPSGFFLDDLFNTSFLNFTWTNQSLFVDDSANGTLIWDVSNLSQGSSFIALVNFTALTEGNSSNDLALVNTTDYVFDYHAEGFNIMDAPEPPAEGENLSVTKMLMDPGLANVNDTIQFLVNITNTGDVAVNYTELFDSYNSSMISFEGATCVPDYENATEGELEWNITSCLGSALGVNQSYILFVNFTAIGGGNTTNFVEVYNSTNDLDDPLSTSNADVTINFSDPDPGQGDNWNQGLDQWQSKIGSPYFVGDEPKLINVTLYRQAGDDSCLDNLTIIPADNVTFLGFNESTIDASNYTFSVIDGELTWMAVGGDFFCGQGPYSFFLNLSTSTPLGGSDIFEIIAEVEEEESAINLSTSTAMLFSFNGTITDIEDNPLQGAVASMTVQSFTQNGQVSYGVFTALTDSSGIFNITGIPSTQNVTELEMGPMEGGLFYQLSAVLYNDSGNRYGMFVSPSLPDFPLMELINMLSDPLLRLKPAITFHIQVEGYDYQSGPNNTNESCPGDCPGWEPEFNWTNVGYGYSMKDQKLGFPVSSDFSSMDIEDRYFSVAAGRNYTLSLMPQSSFPLSVSFTDIESSCSVEGTNISQSGVDANCTITNGTYFVDAVISTDKNITPLTGYVNMTSLDDLVIVAYTVEGGDMVFEDWALPANMGNMETWPQNDSLNDFYNTTSGFYRKYLPATAATSQMMLRVYAEKSGNHYLASFVLNASDMELEYEEYNFSLVPLIEGVERIVSTNDVTQGWNSTQMANTTAVRFRITYNGSLLDQDSSFIEMERSYNGFDYLQMLNAENGLFDISLTEGEGIDKLTIYSQQYAPLTLPVSSAVLEGGSASGIVCASGICNISMREFDPFDPDNPGEKLHLSMNMFKSNSTCDIPYPDEACYVGGSDMNKSEFSPIKAILLGDVSLRIGTGNLSVHYANTDLLASGPPDAAFSQNFTGDDMAAAWKFGSTGPEIYDMVIISMPYAASLENETIGVNIDYLYDNDFNVVWNRSENNLSQVPSNYADYLNSEYAAFLNGSGVECNESDVNLAGLCFKDANNSLIWMRIPHFTGVAPVVGALAEENVTAIIADHDVVDEYYNIPDEYIDAVEHMLVSYPGESHGRGIMYGLELLELEDSRFNVSVTFYDAPENATNESLRVVRSMWNGTTFEDEIGEQHVWTHSAATARVNNHIDYFNSTLNDPFDTVSWAWCYDMTNNGCDGSNWSGVLVNSFDGTNWTDNWDLSTTYTNMDTYLNAFEDFNTDNPGVATYFATGPVDSVDNTGCSGYQRYVKHEYIRDYVGENGGYLYDYADILTHDDEGLQNNVSWSGEIFPYIHPDNTGTYDGGDGDSHIGPNATVRLAKALVWLLARQAGWDGNLSNATYDFDVEKSVLDDNVSVGETLEFVINVTNNGSAPADATHIFDDFNSTLLAFSAANCDAENGTEGPGEGFVDVNLTQCFGDIAVDETVTILINFTAIAEGDDENYVEVSNESTENATAFDSDSALFSIYEVEVGVLSLSVEKSVLDDNVSVGETLEFVINVTNNGSASADAVYLLDDWNASLMAFSGANCTGDNFTENGTGFVDFNVTDCYGVIGIDESAMVLVNFTAVAVGSGVNYVEVTNESSHDEEEEEYIFDSDTVGFSIVDDSVAVSLYVEKYVVVENVTIGGTVGFEVHITNNGTEIVDEAYLYDDFNSTLLSYLNSNCEVDNGTDGPGEGWLDVNVSYCFGNISVNDSVTVYVNFTGIAVGSGVNNVEVSDEFSHDEERNTLDIDLALFNILEGPDVIDPIVNLNYPENNDLTNDSSVVFRFVGIDDGGLDNCTLNVDNVSVENFTSVTSSVEIVSAPVALAEGAHYWNALCFDTNNNSDFSSTNDFNVDLSAPEWFDYDVTPPNGSEYSDSQSYLFNISWVDNYFVDSVWINWAGSNIPITGDVVYEYNTSGLAAGLYNYTWNANDTVGNLNSTGTLYYTISRANSTCTLDVEDVDYGDLLNATCDCDNEEAEEVMLRNGVDVTGEIGIPVILAGGVHNYTCQVAATQNYTSDVDEDVVTVSVVSPSISLDVSPDAVYGTMTNASCTSDDVDVLLYRDDVSINTSESVVLGAGVYNYVCNSTANENYTAESALSNLTISQADDPLTLLLNNLANQNVTINYPENLTAVGNSSSGTHNVFRNGTIVTEGVPAVLPVGTYEYHINSSGNANYTSNVTGLTFIVTVDKTAGQVNLLINGNDADVNVNVDDIVNVTALLNLGQEDIELYEDGDMIHNGSSPLNYNTTYTEEGVHNFTVVYNATENYSSASETHLVTVVDNVDPIVTLVSPADDALINSLTIPFTYDVTDEHGGISNCSLYLDGHLESTNSSIIEGEGVFAVDVSLGTHSWNVTCYDDAAIPNSGTSLELDIHVDNVAPVVELNYPDDGDLLNISSVYFDFNATDNAGIDTCRLYVNDELTQNITNISSGVDVLSSPVNLDEDSYSWYVICNDTYGNNGSADHNDFDIDLSAPEWDYLSSSPSNGTEFTSGETYYFNISWTDNDDVDNVSINWAGTDVPINGSNPYVFNISNLAARTYNYTWYASDHAGNTNSTGLRSYTVAQYDSTCTLNVSDVDYGDPLNATCDCDNEEAEEVMLRNGADVTSEIGVPTVLAGAVYNYTCQVAGTQNYTADSDEDVVTVFAVAPALSLLVSDDSTYGTTTNASCTSSEVDVTLFRDDAEVSNPEITVLGADTYNYTCNSTANQNYTAAQTSDGLTISQAGDSLSLTLNGLLNQNVTINYPENMTAVGNSSSGTHQIFKNGSLVLSVPLVLSVGTYLYHVNGTGNENYTANTTGLSFVVTVDKTAAQVNLLLNGNDSDISVNVDDVLNISALLLIGEDHIELYEDGSLINEGSSSLDNSTTYDEEGTHNFTVVYPATENYSSASETHLVTVVDDVDPVVTLVSPANGIWFTSLTVPFVYNVTDEHGGLANCSIYVDSSFKAVNSSVVEGQNTFNVGVSAGSHNWQVRCFDDAASPNMDESAVRNISIDNGPPTTSISGVSDGAIYNTGRTISFSSSDTGDSGVDYTEYNITGAWQLYNGSFSISAEDNYTVMYRSADIAGNVESTKSVSFSIDTSAPAVAIGNPVNDDELSGDVTINASTDANHTAFLLDGSQLIDDLSPPFEYVLDTTGYADGAHVITAVAYDELGNAGNVSVNVTFDNTAPVSNIVNPASDMNTSDDMNVTVNATDAGVGIYYVQIYDGTWHNASLDSGLWSYNVAFPSTGLYQIKARGIDHVGNVEIPAETINVYYDEDHPVISNIQANPNPVGANQMLTISTTVTDDLSVAEVNATLSSTSVTLTGNGTLYSGELEAPPSDGFYNLTIVAVDTFGNLGTDSLDVIVGAQSREVNYTFNNETDNERNYSSETDTEVKMGVNDSVTGNLTIILFAEAPVYVNTSLNNSVKYVEINVSKNIKDVLDWFLITLHYTDDEIEGLEESSLALMWYNESSHEWIELEAGSPVWCNSVGVNTAENYVWANVSHLSVYGLAGEEEEADPSPGSPGSSSGGGGGGVVTASETDVVLNRDGVSTSVTLRQGQKLNLVLDGVYHSYRVDGVSGSVVTLKNLVTFQKLFLYVGTALGVDLDGDFRKDAELVLAISYGAKATLIITAIAPPRKFSLPIIASPQKITGDQVDDLSGAGESDFDQNQEDSRSTVVGEFEPPVIPPDDGGWSIWYAAGFLLIVIILGLMLFFILRRRDYGGRLGVIDKLSGPENGETGQDDESAYQPPVEHSSHLRMSGGFSTSNEKHKNKTAEQAGEQAAEQNAEQVAEQNDESTGGPREFKF